MSERLSDERLREMAAGEYGGSRQIAPIARELLALRAENERLREALERLSTGVVFHHSSWGSIHAEETIARMDFARAALKSGGREEVK